MALTENVLSKHDVSSSKHSCLAVADDHLDFPGQLNVELPARHWVPVSVVFRRNSKQYYLLSRNRAGKLHWWGWRREVNRLQFDFNIFEVRLAGTIAIDTRVFHAVHPFSSQEQHRLQWLHAQQHSSCLFPLLRRNADVLRDGVDVAQRTLE